MPQASSTGVAVGSGTWIAGQKFCEETAKEKAENHDYDGANLSGSGGCITHGKPFNGGSWLCRGRVCIGQASGTGKNV